MRVLITGAGGQLGGALQRSVPAWADANAIDIEDVDLTDAAMLTARLVVEAPDVIINAAAYNCVDEAEKEEALARAVNADAVAVMVQAMAQTGGKVVQVSTGDVFDGTATRPYPPDATRNPQSAFGRTKAKGEDCLRAVDLLVRTTWVYETGGRNFVRAMIRKMNDREVLSVVADQISSPTWATSLACTIWSLIHKEASGTFHHSDDGAVSWHGLALAVAHDAHALGLVQRIPIINAIATVDNPTLPQRPAYSLLDCSATRTFLGDQFVPWRSNLRLMLESEAQQGTADRIARI